MPTIQGIIQGSIQSTLLALTTNADYVVEVFNQSVMIANIVQINYSFVTTSGILFDGIDNLFPVAKLSNSIAYPSNNITTMLTVSIYDNSGVMSVPVPCVINIQGYILLSPAYCGSFSQGVVCSLQCVYIITEHAAINIYGLSTNTGQDPSVYPQTFTFVSEPFAQNNNNIVNNNTVHTKSNHTLMTKILINTLRNDPELVSVLKNILNE